MPFVLLLALAALVLGSCDEVEPPVLHMADPTAEPGGSELPAHCDPARLPPETLDCTGLYSDLGLKTLAPGVRGYAPAFPLWSDGAEKNRWIGLPPGSTIDASNPNEWVFPIGTKLWKEFVVEGRRVETRLWQKARNNFWVNASYAWNEEESAAIRTSGADIPFGSGTYHIPSQDECEKCHRGRTEHILGFGAVELGLPGASGITLETLASEGLLSPPPASTHLTIGDDGTAAAVPALGWLHANCGITCHNENQLATAFPAGMRLRLDPAHLDGRPVVELPALTTTLGVTVNAANWRGSTRIVPGDPEGSLLYQLISRRGSGMQMPPIATNLVDHENVAHVRDWIRQMLPAASAPPAPVDAAAPPPQVDAATDPGSDVDASPDPVVSDGRVAPEAQDAKSAAGAADAGPSPDGATADPDRDGSGDSPPPEVPDAGDSSDRDSTDRDSIDGDSIDGDSIDGDSIDGRLDSAPDQAAAVDGAPG